MKILISRPEGLGNFLLSTPALNAIRKNLPDAEISVLVDPRAYNLAVGHKSIDKLYKWPDLPKEKFDVGLDFVFSAGAYVSAMRPLCKRIISHPEVNFVKRSEPQHNLEIAAKIGGWKGEPHSLSLFIPESDFLWAKKQVEELKRPIISISQGCETSVPVHRKRLWTLGGWSKLIQLLHDKYNPTFLILGSKNEEGMAKELCERLPAWYNVYNLVCKTTIKQTCALLKESDLFVSLDSGTGHCCAAMGTKQIALYGPTSHIKSPIWQDSKNYVIVRNQVSCSLCYTKAPQLFQQCKNPICMTGIQPEQIINAIENKGWLE